MLVFWENKHQPVHQGSSVNIMGTGVNTAVVSDEFTN